MNWLRLYVEITRDHKIRREVPAIRWAWIAVLTMARQSPLPPALLLSPELPVRHKDLADEANLPLRTVQDAIDLFIDRGMIHTATFDGIPDVWIVTNWRKRQPASDNASQRQADYRASKDEIVTGHVTRHVTGQPGDTSQDCLVLETDTETEEDYVGTNVPTAPVAPTRVESLRAVFGVLANRLGSPTTASERGRYNRAAKELVDAGVSPAEVDALISAAESRWGAVAITPTAISSNVALLRRPARHGKANGQIDQNAANLREARHILGRSA